MKVISLILATVLYPPLLFVGFILGLLCAPLMMGFIAGYKHIAALVLEMYSAKVREIMEQEQTKDA